VNNILTTLSVVLRTAVEWGVIERVPCSIKLLKTPKGEASFHDFDEFERIVEVARSEARALLVVLLGGEAGLRCGEIMGLEEPWRNSGGGGNGGVGSSVRAKVRLPTEARN
jgi:hypothetical protein